jgi:hypothetical protein
LKPALFQRHADLYLLIFDIDAWNIQVLTHSNEQQAVATQVYLNEEKQLATARTGKQCS